MYSSAIDVTLKLDLYSSGLVNVMKVQGYEKNRDSSLVEYLRSN